MTVIVVTSPAGMFVFQSAKRVWKLRMVSTSPVFVRMTITYEG